MAEIVFDKPNERIARHGVSKCVIAYEGKVYPWNGIVSISQKNTESKGEYVYVDGVAVNTRPSVRDSSYIIECLTYPDVVERLLGFESNTLGISLYKGTPKIFHIAWTTNIIDSLENTYEVLNIVYNMRIYAPDQMDTTISNTVDPNSIVFEARNIPLNNFGFINQNRIEINSKVSNQNSFKTIKELIYGSADKNPFWPDLKRFSQIINDRYTFSIGSETSTAGVYQIVDGDMLMGSTSIGIFKINNPSSLVEVQDGVYRKI